MRNKKYSNKFKKQLKKLKGKELKNLIKKRDEILSSTDIDHYKNLKKPLNIFKRVHINNSYVVLFFGNDGIVYFVAYEHHDDVYNQDYSNIKF